MIPFHMIPFLYDVDFPHQPSLVEHPELFRIPFHMMTTAALGFPHHRDPSLYEQSSQKVSETLNFLALSQIFREGVIFFYFVDFAPRCLYV